jgi:hypothetical protein
VTSFGLKTPENAQVLDEADLEDMKFEQAIDAIRKGQPITSFKPMQMLGSKSIKKAHPLINYAKLIDHDDFGSYKHYQYQPFSKKKVNKQSKEKD